MQCVSKMKSWDILLTVAIAGSIGFGSLLHAQSGATAGLTLEQGDALEEKMLTQEALKAYLQLETAGRKDAELLYRIAMEYSQLIPDTVSRSEKQRLGEVALSYSKQAVAADGNCARAYLSLSVSYGRLAFFQDNQTKLTYSRLVRANAETALRLDPKLDYAYYILGAWNFEIANLDFLRRGLAAVIYGGLPEASNEKAVEYLQKAVALAPQRVSHHIELGRTYAAMGKHNLARDELELGLALSIRAIDDLEMKRLGRETLKTLPRKRPN